MPDDSKATPRDFLAVERTFLAWIRTASRSWALGSYSPALEFFLREFSLNMAIYLISVRPIAGNNSSKAREISMAPNPEQGIVLIPSKLSVDETVARLQAILQAKGVKLFTIVDHSGEAASAGLKMPNTKLLIFGNPKAGTPLMLASPSVALDLPLKILVAEDAAGKVWISFNAPAYLQSRYNLPPELLPNIAVIETLAAKAAE
jgi:uncharacterized protein (DUF302 family)